MDWWKSIVGERIDLSQLLSANRFMRNMNGKLTCSCQASC